MHCSKAMMINAPHNCHCFRLPFPSTRQTPASTSDDMPWDNRYTRNNFTSTVTVSVCHPLSLCAIHCQCVIHCPSLSFVPLCVIHCPSVSTTVLVCYPLSLCHPLSLCVIHCPSVIHCPTPLYQTPIQPITHSNWFCHPTGREQSFLPRHRDCFSCPPTYMANCSFYYRQWNI